MAPIRHDPERPVPLMPGDAPAAGTIWEHIATGQRYVVLHVAFMERDLSAVVVYSQPVRTPCPIFVRPVWEFRERFDPVG